MQLINLENIAGVSADSIAIEACELLKSREWDNITVNGIKKNLELSLYRKDSKILNMIKNPNYNGNLQLVMPIKINRTLSSNEAKGILILLRETVSRENNNIDLNGKSFFGHIEECAAKKVLTVDELTSNPCADLMHILHCEFDEWGKSLLSSDLHSRMSRALRIMQGCLSSDRVSDRLAAELNEILGLDKKKVIAGQKITKVVSRILNMSRNYMEFYNTNFTRFADLMSENEVNAYFVVSLNFLDYLRMSDGKSWASCHTTDYHNTRRMDNHYSGAYCQGCLSYANDGVSYVTYIVEAKDVPDIKHIDRIPKLYRCMFHVSDDMKQIIQGRVYPQGSDGNVNLYDTFWDRFTQIMGLNKDEYNCVGRSSSNAYVRSDGANYRDYYEYNDPRLFLANGRMNTEMIIGSIGYSCADGYELDVSDTNTIV